MRIAASIVFAFLATFANAQTSVPVSGLPRATTPLAGDELLSISQGGVTKRATASEIGRAAARPFTGTVSQWPWQLNADETWTLKQPDAVDVTFTQSGTGANVSDTATKLRLTKDVSEYGATTALPSITSAITNAANAAKGVSGAFGSVLFSAPAVYTMATGYQLPASMRFTGCGAGSQNITYSDLTATKMFTISGEMPKIECMILSNSAADSSLTSAIGINVGVDSTSQYDPSAVVRDVNTHGFSIGVNFTAGAYQKLDNVTAFNFRSYGLKIDNTGNVDSGDATILGYTASQSSGSGIAGAYWRGSGGTKVIGSKFLGAQYGWYNEPKDDGSSYASAANTQDLLIVGNSFENASAAEIALTALPHSTFRFPVIVANQMANSPIGIYAKSDPAYVPGFTANIGTAWQPLCATPYEANCVGAPGSTMHGYIGGNVLAQMSTAGIQLENGALQVIGLNSYGTRNIGSGGTNDTWMTPVPILDNRTDFNEGGFIDARDKVPVYNITSNASYTNYYEITLPAARGGRFKVVTEGAVTIGGTPTAFVKTDIFDVTTNGSGVPSVTLIESDTTGAAVDTQQAVSGGVVNVGARLNAAGLGTAMSATMTIVPLGKFKKIKRL